MKKILIPVLAVMLFASCDKYNKTTSGILFKIKSEGNHPQVKTGQLMKLQFIQQVNDSVIASTYDNGLPVYAKVDSVGPIYSVLEILPKLHKGDSVVVIESGDSLQRKGMLPPYMKATDKRKWRLKVVDVFESNEAAETARKAEFDQYKKQQDDLFAKTVASKQGLQKTANGVYVEVKEAGNGPAADSGKFISILYNGKFMHNGKTFETNMSGNKEPIQFPLGRGTVIRGWEEGLKLFRKGGKGTLYIPYAMGYGEGQGPGGLPFQNMIFDVEIVDVKDAPPAPPMIPNVDSNGVRR